MATKFESKNALPTIIDFISVKYVPNSVLAVIHEEAIYKISNEVQKTSNKINLPLSPNRHTFKKRYTQQCCIQ